jgi:hypothetical protein
MDGWQLSDELERIRRSGRSLTEILSRHLLGGKSTETSVRLDGVPAQIRTRHLPNERQKSYHLFLRLCFVLIYHLTCKKKVDEEQTISNLRKQEL